MKLTKRSILKGKAASTEIHKLSLSDIKTDPLAHELAPSEGMQPYLDCLIKAYGNDAVGLEAAQEVIRDLPLQKRYTWRVLSALKWAFADFEDDVMLDLPHIPEPTRSEKTTELELRLQQLRTLNRAAGQPPPCSYSMYCIERPSLL